MRWSCLGQLGIVFSLRLRWDKQKPDLDMTETYLPLWGECQLFFCGPDRVGAAIEQQEPCVCEEPCGAAVLPGCWLGPCLCVWSSIVKRNAQLK